MNRIAEIIARCKAIDAEQAELERKCDLEHDGKFTDEIRTQYQALQTECETLLAEKKTLEADANLRASRTGRADQLQPAIIERRVPANSGAPAPVATNPGTGLTPIEREIPTDDNGEQIVRFSIPKNVKRNGQPRNFHGVVNGLTAEQRAFRFGTWALARLAQDLPSRYCFPQASKFVRDYIGDPLNIAHSESDGTTGGHYLVPEEFSSDLIDLRERYGIVRKLFGRETMSSDVKHIPKRASGLTASFVGENAPASESNMTWTDVQLIAKKIVALSRMSNEFNADAVISIGDTLAGEIAYAFSEKEDQCGFNGDGTSTYGGIAGVRYLLANVDGTTTDSAGLVVAAATGSWGAIVLGDLNNVVGRMPQFADTPNAVWVAHRSFYYGVMQKLEMAAGGTQMMEIANGDRRPRPLFMGYPVEFSQVFPAVTAATGVPVVLGDFTKGAVFGDRQQTSIAFSEDATIGGENVFERNQIAIRGTERFDIVVHGAGSASVVGPIVGLALA